MMNDKTVMTMISYGIKNNKKKKREIASADWTWPFHKQWWCVWTSASHRCYGLGTEAGYGW